ncbi:MAG: very short patch repair endonuclease [Roseovarius sp.]|nr:very short patch repair endonuclease [Roseovarius sp.]
MADKISKEHRSWVMSRIKNKDTKPEKLLRSLLHREGYRFRLHVRNLPGKPDVVFPKYKTVIFVHGCFWHRHEGCPNATTPKTRVAFWEGKFKRTMERDRQNQRELMALGWRVIVVWECELKRNRNELIANLKDKLAERK